MQTQDAPSEFLYQLWPWLEANKNRLAAAAVTIIVLAGIYYFISSQHEQNEITAGEAMTQLLIKPSSSLGESANNLIKLAETYPGTEAAKRALLQAAASLYAGGQYVDAQAQFQKFLDSGATGPLAATAELGVGTCLEAQGKNDVAETAYQRVVSSYPNTVSDLPAYTGMARIAEAQGRLNEALSYYTSAVRIGGDNGTMAQSAYQSARVLKAKLDAATKPAAVMKPAPASAPAPAAAPAVTPTLLIPSK